MLLSGPLGPGSKVGSTVPSALSRTICRRAWVSKEVNSPATRILPSGWMATDQTGTGGAQAGVEGGVEAAVNIKPRDAIALDAVVGRHQTADDNPATAVPGRARDAGQALVNAIGDAGLRVEGRIERAVGIEPGDVVAVGAIVAGEIAANDGLIIRLQHHRVHQRIGSGRGVHRRLAIQLVIGVEEQINRPGGMKQTSWYRNSASCRYQSSFRMVTIVCPMSPIVALSLAPGTGYSLITKSRLKFGIGLL